MIDELDLALVDALRVDPRAPWSRLAEPLGVDPATLSRRWSRLRGSGDAWVTCYPSADRAGTGLTALVQVECTAGQVLSVAQELGRRPWVATVEVTSGGADLLLTVAALGTDGLSRVLLGELATVPGVLRTHTSLVERTLREGSRWHDGALDAGQRAAIATRPASPAPAPRSRAWTEDLSLAQALGADGRATYSELSARTGLPPTTLRRRLAELRDSGRLVLRCDASPALTGHPLGTMLWLDAPGHELPSVARWLSERPQTRMCAVTLGTANLAAYVMTHDVQETRRVEQELSARFPDVRALQRQVTLRTAKLVGHVLNEAGQTVGYVPIAPA